MKTFERLSTQQLFPAEFDETTLKLMNAEGSMADDKIGIHTDFVPIVGASRAVQRTINTLGYDMHHNFDDNFLLKQPTREQQALAELRKAQDTFVSLASNSATSSIPFETEIQTYTSIVNGAVTDRIKKIGSMIASRSDLYITGPHDGTRTLAARLVDMTSIEDKKTGLLHDELVVEGKKNSVGLLPRPSRLIGIHALHVIQPADKVLVMTKPWYLNKKDKERTKAIYDKIYTQVERIS